MLRTFPSQVKPLFEQVGERSENIPKKSCPPMSYLVISFDFGAIVLIVNSPIVNLNV
jgi:hypothetical protein